MHAFAERDLSLEHSGVPIDQRLQPCRAQDLTFQLERRRLPRWRALLNATELTAVGFLEGHSTS